MENLRLSISTFAALCVVLIATLTCGRLAMLVKQPRVVGEMVAGVLLGPSMFGLVAPSLQAWVFSEDVKSVLYVLSTLGLTIYMFLVGTTLDRDHTSKSGARRAVLLAAAGIMPTFLIGASVAAIFAGRLTAPGSNQWQLMLFLGGALSITSLPMLARILEERGITHSRIGSLILMAAAVDDAAAWGILAVITTVGTTGNSTDAMLTILGTALFALFMLTIGRRLLCKLGNKVQRDGELRRDSMAIVLLVVLGAGWFTDIIGVFSVFGGFITGLAMPQYSVFKRELDNRLSHLNSILLMPVFFAFSGLNTNFGKISMGSNLLPMAVILVAATIGKYVGCGLIIRMMGFSWRYASAVGGLMNARGLMILMFINTGLNYHLITSDLFSMLVIVAIVTTAAAMPIYRASMSPQMEDAEHAPAPRALDTKTDVAASASS